MSDLGELKYNDFHWPALLALRELGGSATIQEMNRQVIADLSFTDEDQAVLHKDGPMTAIEYRLHWARTYLKGMGLADNVSRGVWELTELGRSAEESSIPELRRQYLEDMRARSVKKSNKVDQSTASVNVSNDEEPEGSDANDLEWQDQLLEAILELTPSEFEELARWLLRVEGFVETEVVGGSGDGGIDVQGFYRISLLSFQVFVQCKQYRNAVGSPAVRDFRGAMAGRGDKGLLITTASFTSSAEKEARRPGAPPIDLIDGAALCDLLRKHRKGVRVVERIVEDVEIVPAQLRML